MSDAISSQGVTATLDGTSIGEVVSWSDLGITADTDETTHLGSSNNFEEHIKTILRGGEISFECNYVAADYAAIQALVVATGSVDLVLTTTETVPSVYIVPVLVKGNKMNGSSGSKISATVAVQVVGIPVIT